MATYDSGGHHKDQKLYADNYERIFGKKCHNCGKRYKTDKCECEDNNNDDRS